MHVYTVLPAIFIERPTLPYSCLRKEASDPRRSWLVSPVCLVFTSSPFTIFSSFLLNHTILSPESHNPHIIPIFCSVLLNHTIHTSSSFLLNHTIPRCYSFLLNHTIPRCYSFLMNHTIPRCYSFLLNGYLAKYQLSDGSPLVSMASIDENVKFPLNIQYVSKISRQCIDLKTKIVPK
jgi:hypothetical protein